jgi:transcriptional regulator with GAF, ATPase, and Fis domain
VSRKSIGDYGVGTKLASLQGDTSPVADQTRELTLEEVRESLESVRLAGDKQHRLEEVAALMLDQGFDAGAVGSTALDGVLAMTPFERGFLFALERASGSEADARDVPLSGLRVLAARARAAGHERGPWVKVLNPEFAVNRSVIQRALAARDLLVLNDSLDEPGSGGEAQHRAVVCQAFRLGPSAQGVLYLDRGLSREGVTAEDLALLRFFRRCCLPALEAAWIARELDEIRTSPLEADTHADPESEVAGAAAAAAVPAAHEVVEFHGMKSADPKLKRLFDVIEKVKDSTLNICIIGESGTGKEMLARAIHEASRRRERPFVAESCGSIAESLLESELFGHVKGAFTGADEDRKGLFELADGGTLFLDEIGDMSEGMQRKLLRVLQEGAVRPISAKEPVKVDVRVLCASNRDLQDLVRKKGFRADLFYRLNVVSLELPPLREREGDVPLLVAHFASKILREEGISKRFSGSAMKAFAEYTWPGNVRELENVVRRLMLTCPSRMIARKDVIGLLMPAGTSPYSGEGLERDEARLVLRLPARQSFHEIIEECERIVLRNALKECGWNKSKVTQVLRIPRQSLYNKIARYQLGRDS